MAEFKPRSSEGGDDSEDKEGSLVQNWLEKMVGDDEPDTQESDVDKKKKKRFGKLFKPVFRMLFPRNENTPGTDEEQPKRSIFAANILGVSKDVDPDEENPHVHVSEEPNQNIMNISHEEPDTERPVIKSNIETQPLNIPEKPTQPTVEHEDARLKEIAYVSSISSGESSIGYAEPVKKIEKSPPKNEVKSVKEPSVLAFIASEFSARRHRRKQEKAQKKLDKRQKQIEQEAKSTKLRLEANSKKIHNTVKREIKQEIPKYIHENKVKLNQKESPPSQKPELLVVKDRPEKQQEIENKPVIRNVDRVEVEKRELEKQEIERVINDPPLEIKKEEKTERYFETRQEVKDSPQPRDRAKYYSKPSQSKTHDPYDIQSKIGIPVSTVGTKEDASGIDQKNNSQIPQQLVADPGKIIATVFLGIICGLIIIKFLLT